MTENILNSLLASRDSDLSYTAMADAALGFDTWIESMRIRGYDTFGSWEVLQRGSGVQIGGNRDAIPLLRSVTQRAADCMKICSAAMQSFWSVFPMQPGRPGSCTDSREIQIASLGDPWDRNSRLMGGVVLQHEAHRDGVVADVLDQRLETRDAVQAHTEMALRIAGDYGFAFIENDPDLLRDVVAERIARVVGDDFFAAYVDQAYQSAQGDFFSIEKWSGKAIGTPRKSSSYYVIKLEQDTEDAARHDVRSTIGPVFFIVDKIHNLFSNKDRVEMYRPLYDIVGGEDYFGALKILYGTGADALGAGADVVGMIDDVITAYEIIRNVDIPGSDTLNKVSIGLETIDQLVSGVAAGFNTVIEKHFADYWWMSGVPNFATTQSDLEDLTRFMFSHFVEGTTAKDIIDLRQLA